MTSRQNRETSSLKCSIIILIVASVLSTLTLHRHTHTHHDSRRAEELGPTTFNHRLHRNGTASSIVSQNAQSSQVNISFSLQTSSGKDSSLSPLCHPFASLASLPRTANKHPNRRTIRRIYFAHMRKAGGTTLRAYLEAVAQKFGLEFDGSEGGHLEIPGTDINTLYVTHLRDPYRRAISHFQYEVRWPCEKLVLQNDSFVPTLSNAANMTAWISEPAYQHPSLNATRRRRCDDTQAYLIDCAVNCYLRWMNYPSGACSSRVFQRNSVYYIKALQNFRKYDAIIDSDRLFRNNTNATKYAADLESFFGFGGIKSKNRPMYCLRPSRNANRQFPLHVDNDTRSLLFERNQADYDLYNNLVGCPSKKYIQLPRNVTLADFVASTTTAIS